MSARTRFLSARKYRRIAPRLATSWLDALELDDAAPAAPAPLAGPLAPNAAERWDATLPTSGALAIAAERAARTARDWKRWSEATPALALAPTTVDLDPAGERAPQWAWSLASVALMIAVVLACVAAVR